MGGHSDTERGKESETESGGVRGGGGEKQCESERERERKTERAREREGEVARKMKEDTEREGERENESGRLVHCASSCQAPGRACAAGTYRRVIHYANYPVFETCFLITSSVRHQLGSSEGTSMHRLTFNLDF